jgi:hypothetical protein
MADTLLLGLVAVCLFLAIGLMAASLLPSERRAARKRSREPIYWRHRR